MDLKEFGDIQQAFTVTRGMLNLNTARYPQSALVTEALVCAISGSRKMRPPLHD